MHHIPNLICLLRIALVLPVVLALRDGLYVQLALLLALASPDCRAHSPNENFPVENFLTGIQLNKALLKELAR
jgi:hypothetical protein